MSTAQKKAPAAANNRGHIFKLSSHKYRTCTIYFHPMFTAFPSTSDEVQGVCNAIHIF